MLDALHRWHEPAQAPPRRATKTRARRALRAGLAALPSRSFLDPLFEQRISQCGLAKAQLRSAQAALDRRERNGARHGSLTEVHALDIAQRESDSFIGWHAAQYGVHGPQRLSPYGVRLRHLLAPDLFLRIDEQAQPSPARAATQQAARAVGRNP